MGTQMGLKLDAPTVMGLIRTPSSTWAFSASSASLLCRTCLPQSVLTKVVRPGGSVRAYRAQLGEEEQYQFQKHRRPSSRTGCPSSSASCDGPLFLEGDVSKAIIQLPPFPRASSCEALGRGFGGATNCQRTVDNPVARTGCMPDMIAGDGDG